MEDGCVVIAAGGGGIPVTVRDGVHTAVDAIVDKDLTSAILAWRVRADILVILTAVEKVYLDFGKPTQKALDAMAVSEARAYWKRDSSRPVPAAEGAGCVKFVEAHPAAAPSSLRSTTPPPACAAKPARLSWLTRSSGYFSVFHTSA